MFEWDEAKNALNIAKHGVSFQIAQRIFDGPVVTKVDNRRDYGEIREFSIGRVEASLTLVVVHTARGPVTRIISARPASMKEKLGYEEALRPGADTE